MGTYVKNHKEFTVERLSNNTLYSAADKFDKAGQKFLSNNVLQHMDQSNYKSNTFDIIAYEVANYTGKERIYDLEKKDGHRKVNMMEVKSTKLSENGLDFVILKDCKIAEINVSAYHDKSLKVMLTTKYKNYGIAVLLNFSIETVESSDENENITVEDVQLKGNGPTRFVNRTELNKFIKQLQLEYNHSTDISYSGFKPSIHNLFKVSYDIDLTDRISKMFTKNRRTLFSDINPNFVKSTQSINKFNL